MIPFIYKVRFMSNPSKLDTLVAEISGTAESEYIGLYKQIPFRVRLPFLHVYQHFIPFKIP
jgi:hypothetical protein